VRQALRVLFVEDDEDDAQLLVHELRRADYEVSWERVETRVAMAEALDRGGWDAVIADCSLPSFSGVEALELFRERDLELPFIMVSGAVDEAQAVESLRSGAHDFVAKSKLARLGPALARELRETENRRARRQAEAEQHAAEERLRRLVEQMPALSYLGAPTGETHFVGPQIREMTGFSAAEWLADAALWARRIHPEDRERVLAERARTSPGHPFASEYRVFRRDGGLAWWSDEARLVWDAHAARLLLYGFVQDVTKRKAAEEEVRAQREALHLTEKLAAMGELIAGVAHELNNPLAVVLGQASLLRREAGSGRAVERVEKIAKAADRCARIVKNFLAIARQQPPVRVSVDVNGVLEETLELMAHPLRTDGIEVARALSGDLPALSGDAHQIQQMLLNLLSNAQQALRDAPAPRKITVSTCHEAESARIVLVVADNGPGIPAATQGRIFDPFFTTKPAGMGTGLGLPLCRGIVESHAGTIAVESSPGGGARFRIVLPVGSIPPEPIASSPIPSSADPRGKRILVVDDEPAMAELLAELLSDEGHQVDVAENGKAALVRMESTRYDAVISDLRMPELDGPGLYQEAARRYPELIERFGFITGDNLAQETWDFLARTAAPRLAKPFSNDELQRLVRRIVEEPHRPQASCTDRTSSSAL
jgi:two-component system NtrC family sensor kinase